MRGTDFAELQAFVAVAERRSFSGAAAHLGVSRSTLSQNVRALEERLGVRLLNRTTRNVAPTEAGERLLVRARAALSDLAAAAAEAHGLRDEPAGLLRLVMQPPAATFLIGPLVARFLARYPAVRLDLSVQKLPADLVSGGFDAGIRLGEQIERDMIAVRVTGEARFVAVASPKYLARHPPPASPRGLADHDCIRARLPNGAVFGWEFQKSGKQLQVAVTGALIVDDIDLAIRAARDGVGVAYLLRDYVAADLAAGRLVPLVDDWSPRLSGLFLYHSSRRLVTAPLRALIDFLKDASAAPRRPGLTGPGDLSPAKHRLVSAAARGRRRRSD